MKLKIASISTMNMKIYGAWRMLPHTLMNIFYLMNMQEHSHCSHIFQKRRLRWQTFICLPKIFKIKQNLPVAIYGDIKILLKEFYKIAFILHSCRKARKIKLVLPKSCFFVRKTLVLSFTFSMQPSSYFSGYYKRTRS